MPDIITIDGPAASGKSTIAKLLAQDIGFRYLNSGNYYRAYTYAIRCENVIIDDAARMKELLAVTRIDERNDRMIVNGNDVSQAIRGPQITGLVSAVARIPAVRDHVNQALRRVASRYNCVVEGRDIGTVVFPDACLKVFLVASIDERARRRQRDFEALGIESDFHEIVTDIQRRDGLDSSREMAPLKCSDDALVIDSTAVTVDGIVCLIKKEFSVRRSSTTLYDEARDVPSVLP